MSAPLFSGSRFGGWSGWRGLACFICGARCWGPADWPPDFWSGWLCNSTSICWWGEEGRSWVGFSRCCCWWCSAEWRRITLLPICRIVWEWGCLHPRLILSSRWSIFPIALSLCIILPIEEKCDLLAKDTPSFQGGQSMLGGKYL